MKKVILFTCLIAFVSAAAFTKLGKGGGTWEVLQTKNKLAARSECSFVATEEGMFLIGGDGPAMEVQDLDLVTMTWVEKAKSPVPMHHLQAVGLNNKIYVLGAFTAGSFPDQTPIANVYVYDTQIDMWETGGEIPADRRRRGAGSAEYKGIFIS